MFAVSGLILMRFDFSSVLVGLLFAVVYYCIGIDFL